MKKKLFNNLSLKKKQEFTKKKYNYQSFFQKYVSNKKSNKEINIHQYSKIFREEINRLLNKKKIINRNIELEKIHLFINKSMKDYNLSNGVNKISQMFYNNDKKFKSIYFLFIRNLSKNIFKFPFYFQEIPTIRFQCPDGKNSHHYPRYHNDIAYGHPFEEINIWIPLTLKNKTEKHGFRIMNMNKSSKLLKSYNYSLDNFVNNTINNRKINFKYNLISPKVDIEFGKMIVFDSRCLHTGEFMSKQTRVSIDIRIIPVNEYRKMIKVVLSDMKKIKIPGLVIHSHADKMSLKKNVALIKNKIKFSKINTLFVDNAHHNLFDKNLDQKLIFC